MRLSTVGLKRQPLALSYLIVLALAIVLIASWLVIPGDPYGGNLASYLPFHMFAETASIVISIMIFGVAWNAFSSDRPGVVVVLACAMLAAGLIDFGHMLSVSRMPDFVTPAGPEKGIAFWLVARMTVAAGFAAAAWQGEAPLRRPESRYVLLGIFLGIVVLIYWLALFHLDALPDTFEPGKGLTALKVAAELSIVAVLVPPVIVFHRRACRTRSDEDTGLFAAASVTMLCEMWFAIYAAPHDLFQVLGHVYKIIAYLLLWRAVFVVNVRYPFERLRELSQRMVATQEEERRGLAMVVHDRISPNLAAAKIQLDTIRAALPSKVLETLAPRFEDARALIEDTDAGMRDLCTDLRDPVLDFAGLLPALENYVHRFGARTGLAVSLSGQDSGARLSKDLELMLFRIVQEALTNCAKHAGADKAKVIVWHDGENVRLTIEDNGKGFQVASLESGGLKPGHGLLSMCERAEFVGGTFRLDSSPGHGTRITVAV